MSEHQGSWISEYVALLHDPAHILFELTLMLVFDFLIGYVGYKLLFKRIIVPRLRKQIHEEIDRDHDLVHEESVSTELFSGTSLQGEFKIGDDNKEEKFPSLLW